MADGDADAQGIRGIEARAASVFEHWVGSEGSASGGATVPSSSATSSSSTGSAKDGETFGVGLNFLVPAADGRIERDYTFVVAERAARRKTAWAWREVLYLGARSCDR
jgi:hypothetical protein